MTVGRTCVLSVCVFFFFAFVFLILIESPTGTHRHALFDRFFVIKTYSEDEIHRSIKYGVWSGAEHSNRRLDAVWRESNRSNSGAASSVLFIFPYGCQSWLCRVHAHAPTHAHVPMGWKAFLWKGGG